MKKLIKMMVFVLSVLVVYTIGEYLESHLISMKNDYNHFVFTLIAVALIAVVICPFFKKLEDWTSRFSMWYLRAGKHITEKKIGIFFAFFLGIAIVYYFLFKLWYEYDPWLYFLNYITARLR